MRHEIQESYGSTCHSCLVDLANTCSCEFNMRIVVNPFFSFKNVSLEYHLF